MTFDMMTAINFVLAVIILAMGVLNYSKKKEVVSLYVGVGFGFFAVSHLLTLVGMGTSLALPLAVVRTIGYMSIIIGLYIAIKPMAKPAAKKKK